MIVLSAKKETEIFNGVNNTSKDAEFVANFNLNLDFGTYPLVINDLSSFLEISLLSNRDLGCNDTAILDYLDKFNNNGDLIYVYEVVSGGVKSISIEELLNSEDEDKFTLGCLLKANLLYCITTRRYQSLIIEKIDISKEQVDFYYSNEFNCLKDLVLSKDTTGLSSYIISMLLDDRDDVFYDNAVKLDKTGEISHAYMVSSDSYLESAVERIMEVDKVGCYITDSLMWLNKSPLELANKIVQINNPFAILTFKNRYEEYLINVKEDGRNSGFLLDEVEVTQLLNNSLLNFDFKAISLTDEMKGYNILEQTFVSAVIDITEILVTNENYDNLLSFFNFLNKYSRDKAQINEYCHIIKEKIRKIKHYTLGKYSVIIFAIDGFIFGAIKDTDKYFELCEALAWGKETDISLNLLLS